MIHAAFLIPALPLAGFAILLVGGRRLGNPLAGWIATSFIAASFVVTVIVFWALFARTPPTRFFTENLFTWISVDRLNVGVGLLIDPLSMTMAAFITGVSALIHLYSIGYMEHDERYSKFFVYMNLFVFAMLMLVLANNFLVAFFGWEGVGVCSYFLIAFWFGRPTAASAGKKAMIYNRIGDAGFLVALFLIFEKTGSLTYTVVFAHLSSVGHANLVAIVLLLFLGACGKSAQIPLFPWLADAMEGPTPVSALIHAATMVTAGVYLMCRINPILALVPEAAHTIAWVGAVTAFVAATAACAQTDIKKVLAYSTVSQLGFMFLAVGTGAYVAAIFLMLTHAFYKALLFLGAGSVIHAMDDEQDIKRMGALRALMPVTAIACLIGWFSIAGVPPFSGFWSKGDVLMNAWAVTPALWGVAAVTALLTAYYMGRQYYLVFLGAPRWSSSGQGALAHPAYERKERGLHPKDARRVMTFPLIFLAVCAGLAGFIDLPFHPDLDFLQRWLAPVVGANLAHPKFSLFSLWAFSLIDTAIALVGIAIAALVWKSAVERRAIEPRFLFMAWFVDWTYDKAIAKPSEALASFAASVIDVKVIDGAVNGVAGVFRRSGSALRKVQSGYVRSYALGLFGGAVLIVAYVLIRARG